jgi:hypothetical protein
VIITETKQYISPSLSVFHDEFTDLLPKLLTSITVSIRNVKLRLN